MALTPDRAYAAGKYGLELDNILAGWVSKVSGGGATADVVNEKVGVDHLIKKHLAGLRYEEIVLEAGTGMSKEFYKWIEDSFGVKSTPKEGAIIAADYDFKEQRRMTFSHALVTEFALPALDAASKDAAKMTLKIKPEITRTSKGSGKPAAGPGTKQSAQKKWLPANFKLEIAGLDCTRVNKIDPLVFKQKVVEHAVGELRDYEREPASTEFSNLVVTLAESYADSWYKWFDDFVVNGNNTEDKEKSGTLTYLTPNLQETLFQVTFSNLGIFKLAEEHTDSAKEGVRRVKAELYVERMHFTPKSAAT
jgi:phage tail-like protein